MMAARRPTKESTPMRLQHVDHQNPRPRPKHFISRPTAGTGKIGVPAQSCHARTCGREQRIYTTGSAEHPNGHQDGVR